MKVSTAILPKYSEIVFLLMEQSLTFRQLRCIIKAQLSRVLDLRLEDDTEP